MIRFNPYKKLWLEFYENRVAFLALLILIVLIVLSLLASIISPQDPYNLAEINILEGRLPPGTLSNDGYTYLLGTDDQGRDMLSAILYGLRISLGVGVVSGLFAFILGLTVGLFAAYKGGKIDIIIMLTLYKKFIIKFMILSVLLTQY